MTIRVPFSNLRAQYASVAAELRPRLDAVLASGQYVLGPEVEGFEREFAAYCETRSCVGVNNGTSALHLALRCLDVGPGDEVIVPAMTFVATAWAVSYTGATPVFVDVDPRTRVMDASKLAAAIGPRTRAIMPVHLYGYPADMDAIAGVAAARGIPVVEDAAQAHGATLRGRRIGGLGRAGCFSFYPGKNLGAAGEAGALVTADEALAARARALRDHAQRERYRHEELGYNYRMEHLQGAVLRVKLARLDAWNAARRRHAQRYLARLSGQAAIGVPQVAADVEPVWHLFVVELDRRDEVAAALRAAGIETGLHYPTPVHLQPAYQGLGHGPGSFPVAERLAQRCLSLPLYPELTEAQVDAACDALLAAVPSA